ncbi:MAG TPA: alpha/beta fold hydrolase [Spirochaetia bacterium]|nr:alpha/beta fold hydrolase [Spirochaetia bacterium]
MPFAKVNGIHLHYRVSGKGEPLVLIAGWGTDSRTWAFQLLPFQKSFLVVRFDNRGVGRSDKPQGPYTMKVMAADVIGLMDHLGIGAANVVGLSMGGMIAQEVAINYPDRVLKLVLGSTFACQRNGSGPTAECARHAGGDARQFRLALASLAGKRSLGRLVVLAMIRLLSSYGMEGFKSQGAAIREHDTSDRLHLIQCPTLVIAGTRDRVIRPSSSEFIVSRLPRGSLKMIENGSHSISSENRREFNDAVLGFLTMHHDPQRDEREHRRT